EDVADVVVLPPARIVGGEATVVADPPDVVADAVLLRVAPLQLVTGDLRREGDGLEHRRVAEPAAPDVVDLAAARRSHELVEGPYQIGRVDGVPHLLAPVAVDGVGRPGHRASNQVG